LFVAVAVLTFLIKGRVKKYHKGVSKNQVKNILQINRRIVFLPPKTRRCFWAFLGIGMGSSKTPQNRVVILRFFTKKSTRHVAFFSSLFLECPLPLATGIGGCISQRCP
jgi:hypothetical protein